MRGSHRINPIACTSRVETCRCFQQALDATLWTRIVVAPPGPAVQRHAVAWALSDEPAGAARDGVDTVVSGLHSALQRPQPFRPLALPLQQRDLKRQRSS